MRTIATNAGVALATVAATALPSSTFDRRHLSYETIAGYSPGSEVTDHCAIDLDQAAIESQLVIKTSESFGNALRIYNEGGHSKSYARITLESSLPFDVRKWTEIAGFDETGNEVLGRAYADHLAGDSVLRVQYPPHVRGADGCHVGGLSTDDLYINAGGCLVAQGDVRIAGDDAAIGYAYDPLSDNDNGRTIAGFSTTAQTKMLESQSGIHPEFEFFYEYYGSASYADDWITSALGGKGTSFTNGNADFSTLGFDGKAAFVGRGTVLMNVFMEVLRLFVDAMDDCRTDCDDCNEDAVHSWDAGVCTYVGSLSKESYRERDALLEAGSVSAADQEGDVGDRGGKLLHSLADEMCSNFATCGPGGDRLNGESQVNRRIKDLFRSGKYELSNGSCGAVWDVVDGIAALMHVPLVQGTLLYARRMEASGITVTGMAEEDRGAGAAFAAAVLPRVHAADPSYASYIHAMMKVGTAGVDSRRVKATFENVYGGLGIACADVGGIWDHENDGYYPGLEPCVDLDSNGPEPQDLASCMIPGSDSRHSFCMNGGACLDTAGDNEQHKGCICKGEFEGPHCEFVVVVVGTAPTRPATSVTLDPNNHASLSPSSDQTSSPQPQALASPAPSWKGRLTPSPTPGPTSEETFVFTEDLDSNSSCERLLSCFCFATILVLALL